MEEEKNIAPMQNQVTEEDRELFILLLGLEDVCTEDAVNRIRNGAYDDWKKIQLLARHRLAALRPTN